MKVCSTHRCPEAQQEWQLKAFSTIHKVSKVYFPWAKDKMTCLIWLFFFFSFLFFFLFFFLQAWARRLASKSKLGLDLIWDRKGRENLMVKGVQTSLHYSRKWWKALLNGTNVYPCGWAKQSRSKHPIYPTAASCCYVKTPKNKNSKF